MAPCNATAAARRYLLRRSIFRRFRRRCGLRAELALDSVLKFWITNSCCSGSGRAAPLGKCWFGNKNSCDKHQKDGTSSFSIPFRATSSYPGIPVEQLLEAWARARPSTALRINSKQRPYRFRRVSSRARGSREFLCSLGFTISWGRSAGSNGKQFHMPKCSLCGNDFAGNGILCPACYAKTPRTVVATRRKVPGTQQYIAILRVAPMTTALIAINLLIYVLMAVSTKSIDFSVQTLVNWGGDYAPLTRNGEWWRLLTSTFVHGGLLHVGLNMWCLLMLGPLAEVAFGKFPYLAAYIATGLCSSLYEHSLCIIPLQSALALPARSSASRDF